MLKNGRKGLFGHKRGKGSRFLSFALSAAMLAGSVPSGAFSVYAESRRDGSTELTATHQISAGSLCLNRLPSLPTRMVSLSIPITISWIFFMAIRGLIKM